MAVSRYALIAPASQPQRPLPDAVKRRLKRSKPKPRYGTQYRAYRRITVAGQILFSGAFLFVASAFGAMVYAWRKL